MTDQNHTSVPTTQMSKSSTVCHHATLDGTPVQNMVKQKEGVIDAAATLVITMFLLQIKF